MKRLLAMTIIAVPLAGHAQPPQDGVCSELKGGTPGLFGLCVAFCEAQDLGEAGEIDTNESAMSLLANYDRKRRAGDPDMPCLAPEASCACWDAATLEAALPSPDECRVTATKLYARQETAGVRSYAEANASNSFFGNYCDIQDGVSGSGFTMWQPLLSGTELAGCKTLWMRHAKRKGCYVPPPDGQ
jgi:hypothetical protein